MLISAGAVTVVKEDRLKIAKSQCRYDGIKRFGFCVGCFVVNYWRCHHKSLHKKNNNTHTHRLIQRDKVPGL